MGPVGCFSLQGFSMRLSEIFCSLCYAAFEFKMNFQKIFAEKTIRFRANLIKQPFADCYLKHSIDFYLASSHSKLHFTSRGS